MTSMSMMSMIVVLIISFALGTFIGYHLMEFYLEKEMMPAKSARWDEP